ncbi:MAG: DUF1592 domain-containing protein [Myxococcota bacterium]
MSATGYRRGRQVLPWVTALALAGCYGGLRDPSAGAGDTDPGGADDGADDDGADDGADDGDGDGADDGPNVDCSEVAAGYGPMRRLTKAQYENTIRDLFDGAIEPGDEFPVSVIHEEYSNNPAANIVSLSAAEDILLAAERAAEQVVDQIDEIVDCTPGPQCAATFVDDFGRRALRRPLMDSERDALMAAYSAVEAEVDFADGIGTVVTIVLQSPQFLYLVEPGAEEIQPGIVALTDYELASRLSYLLWDTTPDEELLSLAEAGALSDPDTLAAQAERLLLDRGRSGPALDRFFREWIHFDGVPAFDKDAEVFPAFTDTLSSAMDEELSRFFDRVMSGDTPTLAHLLTSTETEVDAELAAFYGVDAPASGWGPATLPAERPGLLSRAGILAEHSTATSSAPIFRGRLVRTQLLCDAIPAPPDDAMANAPEYPAGATERERSDILMEHMNCGACHGLMNPIGLGFEHFDASGAWRDLDVDGSPVNDMGEVLAGIGGLSGEFDGVDGLATMLADDDSVAACFTRQFYRHTLGLEASRVVGCAIEPMELAFLESGGDIPTLIATLVQSDAFRMRVLEDE